MFNNFNETTCENLIKKYARDYYTGTSSVSDDYFDSLVDRLKELNPNNKILSTPGWGYTPGSKKAEHWWNLQIGSLDKIKDGEAVPARYGKDTRVSAKLDGLSVVSYYVDGNLIQSITRGNGIVGQDVTNKIKLIDTKIVSGISGPDGTPFTGAVRGEVVMPMSVWYNKYESQKKDNPSLNPRNIASGLLNRDDFTVDDAADLDYVVYKVLYCDDGPMSLKEVTSVVRQNFTTTVDYVIGVNTSELKSVYDTFCKKYPCDGLVFTNLGDNFEYDEIAFKFQAESEEVVVTNITYSPTRTGRMAPVIWFDPVELSGAIVQKCTGYNAMFIKENSIGKGAVIKVCRSNEVIPTVLGVVAPAESPELPAVCPRCGTTLKWIGDDLICESENESQLSYNFLSTIATIDGVGDHIYSSIVEGCGLTNLDNLVEFLNNLKYFGKDVIIDSVWESSGLTGSVTYDKVSKVLEKLSGEIDAVTFLTACNIKGVSTNTAEKIVDEYPDFFNDSYSNFDIDKLYKINDVGDRTVNTLIEFKDRIRRLYSCVNVIIPEKTEKQEISFKVAITGALSMKRADFDKILNSHGIKQSGNFKEIKYLITNNPDSTSSKMKQAKENNVEIISESEFLSKYIK